MTMARIPAKKIGRAMEKVRDDLEQEMIQSHYLDNAPFKWVGLIIREGLVNETKPEYEGINRKYGDLPVAIQIDTHRLVDATEDEMAMVYREATLISLVHIGEKYNLKIDRVKKLLAEIETL